MTQLTYSVEPVRCRLNRWALRMSASTGVDRPTERFRILNGLGQHAQVKSRDRVKIVMD
ncbi:hypothetical protein [Bradyrhizobium sp. RDI18]|uniref:hypothetical protein n=1 Tax=Bradyrhizobium sp. RDI18 TaxID=3367400 RepID=UPI00372486D4